MEKNVKSKTDNDLIPIYYIGDGRNISETQKNQIKNTSIARSKNNKSSRGTKKRDIFLMMGFLHFFSSFNFVLPYRNGAKKKEGNYTVIFLMIFCSFCGQGIANKN